MHRRLNVDDDLLAAVELNRQHVAAAAAVEIIPGLFEPVFKGRHFGFGHCQKFSIFIHCKDFLC